MSQNLGLKFAIAGLGSMGARHAQLFHDLVPRAELIAASPDPKEISGATRLNLIGTRLYHDYDETLREQNKKGTTSYRDSERQRRPMPPKLPRP